jgi:hypothetical protein
MFRWLEQILRTEHVQVRSNASLQLLGCRRNLYRFSSFAISAAFCGFSQSL